MKNKGVIFDLDGTIWDSSESVVRAWNEVISTYNEIKYTMTIEAMKGFMGKTIEEIARLFFYDISFEKAMEITRKCCLQEQQYLAESGGKLFEGIENTLERLSVDYSLFIVSNCQTGYIDAFFKYHKLDKFITDYEIAGRTGKAKGDNIKQIIIRNHLEKAVYIGDTQGDYAAARNAQIPFIHASYGFGVIDTDVPFAKSVAEIPLAVKELI